MEDNTLWNNYAKTRSIEDRNILVVEYLMLCTINSVKLFQSLPDNVSLDDLYQAGVIGLIQAVERFDPSLGYCFATYASHRVRGEMLSWVRDKHDWMKRTQRHENPDVVMLSYDAIPDVEQNELNMLAVYDNVSVYDSQMSDLEEAIEKLSRQDRELVHMLLQGLTQRVISKIFQVSPSRISQRVGLLIRLLKDLVGVQTEGAGYGR